MNGGCSPLITFLFQKTTRLKKLTTFKESKDKNENSHPHTFYACSP